MMATEPCGEDQKKSGAFPITAFLVAAGIGVAAMYLVSKSRAAQPEARAADLLDRCDRAATQLDRRLSDDLFIQSA